MTPDPQAAIAQDVDPDAECQPETGAQPEIGAQPETSAQPEAAVEQLLVEEVSIDGLCGVY